jgi:Domain of unknown function DUF29
VIGCVSELIGRDGGAGELWMTESTLYDDDIVLWSEQQAAAIRKLGKTGRDLPNEFDIENVAEEIESVGRSELAAVESYIELIFLHLMKLLVETDSQAARHWRGELVGFHSRMLRRHAPSMRQRIDIDRIWRTAREQLMLSYEGTPQQSVTDLSAQCPYSIDDLVIEHMDGGALLERFRR